MGIANIINSSNASSGGEIVRELVNASDGAGLHFANQGNISLANSAAAEFGTADFSIEFVLNQTGDNTNDNGIYYSHESGNSRVYFYNDISEDALKIAFIDSGGSSTVKTINYDMSADYNTPTHYVLTFDRDGDATLYKNGNSVGSVDISAFASIDIGSSNSAAGLISTSANGYGVLGTFYRFRTWNKLLSSAEVQTAFERSDVPVADQYGSQTELIQNGTDWTGASGTTPPSYWTVGNVATFTIDPTSGSGDEPALQIEKNGANPSMYQTQTVEVGKQYRVTYRVKNNNATNVTVRIGSTANGSEYNSLVVSSTSWNTVTRDVTATTTTLSVGVEVTTSTASQSGYIDSVSVVQTGVVQDLDLAFANPTQSLMVQDRSGAADGTCSASGVTQVQPVVQLNATAARIGTSAGTPADRELLLDKYLTFSHIYPQVVTSSTASEMIISGGNATSNGANISLRGSTHGTPSSVRFRSGTTTTLTLDSTGAVSLGPGTEAVTTLKPSLLVTDTSVGGSVTIRGKSPVLAFDRTDSGTGTILTDGAGLNIKSGTLDSHGDTHLAISSTGLATFTRDAGSVIIADRTSSDGDVIGIKKDNAIRVRIGSAGITFPNGGNAPTAAANNQLDYYGEGTFTPTVRGSTTAGSYSISTAIGRYTRIGNVVTVNVSLINITEVTAGSGNLEVGGLPFQSIASSTQGFIGSTRFRSYTDAGSSPVAFVQGNSQAVKFVQYVSGGVDDNIDISGVISGSSDISFSITYFV